MCFSQATGPSASPKHRATEGTGFARLEPLGPPTCTPLGQLKGPSAAWMFWSAAVQASCVGFGTEFCVGGFASFFRPTDIFYSELCSDCRPRWRGLGGGGGGGGGWRHASGMAEAAEWGREGREGSWSWVCLFSLCCVPSPEDFGGELLGCTPSKESCAILWQSPPLSFHLVGLGLFQGC